ncbi:MAG: electron transport complex protein RnfG [Methyloprofundus sp.]|nr:MAG: electron transport complex protein RnfG [Methyloprofundus sp.]
MISSSPFHAALRVGLFSFVIIGLVTLVFHGTKDKIAANKRNALLQNLQAVLPQASYDNDLANDIIQQDGYTIYRARKAGQPVAAVISTSTTQGYNGDIQLLIAINIKGEVMGVRVLSHQETPGLGDKIELKKSDWILGFQHKSLQHTLLSQWAVQRDGGIFEQFTGATITPRAIVNKVKTTGLFFLQHQQSIFQ